MLVGKLKSRIAAGPNGLQIFGRLEGGRVHRGLAGDAHGQLRVGFGARQHEDRARVAVGGHLLSFRVLILRHLEVQPGGGNAERAQLLAPRMLASERCRPTAGIGADAQPASPRTASDISSVFMIGLPLVKFVFVGPDSTFRASRAMAASSVLAASALRAGKRSVRMKDRPRQFERGGTRCTGTFLGSQVLGCRWQL